MSLWPDIQDILLENRANSSLNYAKSTPDHHSTEMSDSV